jgi:hypothetical protein
VTIDPKDTTGNPSCVIVCHGCEVGREGGVYHRYEKCVRNHKGKKHTSCITNIPAVIFTFEFLQNWGNRANKSKLQIMIDSNESNSGGAGNGGDDVKQPPQTSGGGVRKKTHRTFDGKQFYSVIECGFVDPATGERTHFEYSEFHGEEVEVFVAASDPQRRHLTRATLLSRLFQFENNKVRCIEFVFAKLKFF